MLGERGIKKKGQRDGERVAFWTGLLLGQHLSRSLRREWGRAKQQVQGVGSKDPPGRGRGMQRL